MFRREEIHEADGFGKIARDEDRAAIRERAAREIGRGQVRKLAIDFGGDFLAQGAQRW